MPDSLAEFWVFVAGKGGVGKSVIALNSARALAEAGRRVLLLDADLGLANLHVLANVQPRGALERVLARATDLDAAITPLPFGADLLAAESGQNLCMLAGSEAADELADTLGRLNARYDYILVDTPRGISEASLQFCRACDRTLLVTTAEPTAITNSYAWYKIATLGDRDLPVSVVANRTAETSLEARFQELCRRFLGAAPGWAGNIPEDPLVGQSVAQQQPLFEMCTDSPAWQAIRALTRKLQVYKAHSQTAAVASQGSAGAGPPGD